MLLLAGRIGVMLEALGLLCDDLTEAQQHIQEI